MSLYNQIYGLQQTTFYLLPMVIQKHPDELPRFRDCFNGIMERDMNDLDEFNIPKRKLKFEEGKRLITLFTRTGGGNREDYETQIKELRSIPGYQNDYDDAFDNTFALFIYEIPEEFANDYDLIMKGKMNETSTKYQETVRKVFPKLNDALDKIFKLDNHE